MTASGANRYLLGLPLRASLTFLSVFAVAFALYVRAWPQAPVVSGDASEYLEVAADLADSRLDSIHDRPVGLPLLVVATGGGARPTRTLFHVLLLCHFASIWLLAVALERIGVSTPLLLLFGGILLLPPYTERAGYVLTEAFSEFTLSLGLVGVLMARSGRRFTWLAIGSLAVGFAAWVRPVYEFLAPALIANVLLWAATAGGAENWRKARQLSLGLIVFGIVPVLGYCQFNASRFGFFGISPRLGYDLSTRTVSVVERLPEEYRNVRELLVEARNRSITKPGSSHTGSQYIFLARESLSQTTGLERHVALSRYLVRLNLDLIRRAPLNYLNEVFRTMGSYCMPAATELATFGSKGVQLGWVLLHLGILVCFLAQALPVVGIGTLMCMAALRRMWLRPAFFAALPLSLDESFAYTSGLTVVAYTLVLSCAVGTGDPRYRAPTDAIVVFLTVLGMHIVAGWMHQRGVGVEAGGEE